MQNQTLSPLPTLVGLHIFHGVPISIIRHIKSIWLTQPTTQFLVFIYDFLKWNLDVGSIFSSFSSIVIIRTRLSLWFLFSLILEIYVQFTSCPHFLIIKHYVKTPQNSQVLPWTNIIFTKQSSQVAATPLILEAYMEAGKWVFNTEA